MVRGIRDGTQGSHKWKLTWSQSSLSKTAVVPKSYVMGVSWPISITTLPTMVHLWTSGSTVTKGDYAVSCLPFSVPAE